MQDRMFFSTVIFFLNIYKHNLPFVKETPDKFYLVFKRNFIYTKG